MVPILFLLAVLAIVGISRYNEDDRLFWKLIASVTIAFALTDIVSSAYNKYDGTVDSPVQVQKAMPSVDNTPAIDFANTEAKVVEKATIAESTNIVPAIGGLTKPSLTVEHNARGQPHLRICSCMIHHCKGNDQPAIQDDS